MQVRKQELELDIEQQSGSKLEKAYVNAVRCHPAYLTYIIVHHMKRWAGISTSWNQNFRASIGNLRYADDTTLMAENGGLKGLLMKVKVESEKVGLKLSFLKTKTMASGPITSWQIDGETVETVSHFIFWVPKSVQMVIAAMKLKDSYSLEGKLWST